MMTAVSGAEIEKKQAITRRARRNKALVLRERLAILRAWEARLRSANRRITVSNRTQNSATVMGLKSLRQVTEDSA